MTNTFGWSVVTWGPGLFDTGRPRAISTWGWPDGFGSSGIDAALSSGGVAESTFGQLSKCYFFDGDEYVRVTRGDVGAGTVDPGYPKPISNWGWPGGFGRTDHAALSSGVVTEGAGFQPPSSKCYFFDGDQYIRVTRGDVGAGTVDPGYPKPISNWGWPGGFGSNGIDAALYSGSKCYFFDGDQYIRVTRGDVGAGTVDPGYPRPISDWGWPAGFAGAPGPRTVRLHVKVLTGPPPRKDRHVDPEHAEPFRRLGSTLFGSAPRSSLRPPCPTSTISTTSTSATVKGIRPTIRTSCSPIGTTPDPMTSAPTLFERQRRSRLTVARTILLEMFQRLLSSQERRSGRLLTRLVTCSDSTT